MRRSAEVVLLAAAVAASLAAGRASGRRWSASERAEIAKLRISTLPPLPRDPSNRVADDSAAAALGHALFFDDRLSANGKVSCGTCHDPAREFQDGVPLGVGVGTAGRRTMPVPATAHGAWFFWDGRADSQWAQALGPLESAVEHGTDRVAAVRVVATHHRAAYERVFGALPSLSGLPAAAGPVDDPVRRTAWLRIAPARRQEIGRVYANIGKAIAAYERGLAYAPARFDRYADAIVAGRPPRPADLLTPDEQAGLALFIGKGNCTQCHGGPLLTDGHFHNIATQLTAADSGRAVGVRLALASEFRCTGPYSDAAPDDCSELRFADTDSPELLGAFKTPSLRGVAGRAPFFHGGQAATMAAVMDHYAAPPRALVGTSELKTVRLSARERAQLEAFLRTLSAPLHAPAGHLAAPSSPRR